MSAVKEVYKRDSKARVIMCSVMSQQAIVIRAIQSGAKDFIDKPFQTDRVLGAFTKVLK